ncbi:MAG TPA: flavodoxin family protein [Caldithrix sp.]|nr:flavodoxin family protein [Caldithrix sp.]
MKKQIPGFYLTLLFLGFLCQALFAQNVLVVYYSRSGHTKALAHAVADGAKSVPGTEVRLLAVQNAGNEDVLWADAIIVGSPVHSANVSTEIQNFINHWPFQEQKLKNKIGAAFVTGGGISAGEELTQLNILHSMLIFNMIVVGGENWRSAFGASGITEEEPFTAEKGEEPVDKQFLNKGTALGKRVAEVAKQFVREK